MNLSQVNTKGENDFIVFLKDLGVVIIEVKRSSTPEALKKAEKQLDNGKEFIDRLVAAIVSVPTSTYAFPCIKMIMIPECPLTSPVKKTSDGYHLVYKIEQDDFKKKWTVIKCELRSMKENYAFLAKEFKRLVRLMVGIWAMKPLYHGHSFDDRLASLSQNMMEVDSNVNEAYLSSDQKKVKSESKKDLPVTNIVYCQQESVFRKSKSINLMYLTPRQKDLYDNYSQVIIRGHAGAGKSIITIFKILDIVQNVCPRERILLVAPRPHHLRFKNILTLNNVHVTESHVFPPNCLIRNVVIMTISDFFNISKEKLLTYDISSYHVFMDDMQSYNSYRKETKFDDIAEFIRVNSSSANMVRWFALDVIQGEYFDLKNKNSALRILYNENGDPRKWTLPIYNLEEILRNSEEITKVVMASRNQRISEYNIPCDMVFDAYPGHKIQSRLVEYHKLSAKRRENAEQFVIDRLAKEFKSLLAPYTQNHTFPRHSIAILYGGTRVNTGDILKQNIEMMLVKQFNITKTQTIEEQSISNHQTMVIDEVNNAMSFEYPCVVYINLAEIQTPRKYTLLSRARARLIIIDGDVHDPPFLKEDINLVWWYEENGEFLQK